MRPHPHDRRIEETETFSDFERRRIPPQRYEIGPHGLDLQPGGSLTDGFIAEDYTETRRLVARLLDGILANDEDALTLAVEDASNWLDGKPRRRTER